MGGEVLNDDRAHVADGARLDREEADRTGSTGRDIVHEALQTFSEDAEADRVNREEMLIDLAYQSGNQWESMARREREDLERPTFTVDMLSPAIRQVDGELRRNPPQPVVSPGENGDVETAEIMGGMVRAIENQSSARRVYARAGGQAAACGRGNFRISLEYEEGGFNTVLRVRPINNPLAVVWDAGAGLPDKFDANHVFVYEDYTARTFRKRWPKAMLADGWPRDGLMDVDSRALWMAQDRVRVCEYWCVTEEPGVIVLFEDGQIVWYENDDQIREIAAKAGAPVRFRKEPRRVITMHMLTALEVLGTYKWPGSILPIFSSEGEEIFIEGARIRRGMIREARDAQLIRNWSFSSEVEAAALNPVQKWVATAKQVKGREQMWREANTIPTATLIYEHDDKAAGPPQRMHPPTPNPAAQSLTDRASDAIKSATGMFNASLGKEETDQSGRAINALKSQSDTGNYLYTDNLTAAVEACGKAQVEMMPKVYDTERQVLILGRDEARKIIRVNDGKYNLNRGKYDLSIRTGPSYATQREASSDILMRAAELVPEPVRMPLVMRALKNMDVPDIDTLSEEMTAVATAAGLLPPPAGAGMPGTPVGPGAAGPGLAPPVATPGADYAGGAAAEFEQRMANAPMPAVMAEQMGPALV